MEANRRRVPGHHDTSGRGAPDEVHFPCPDCEQVFNTFTDLRHHCFVGHMGIAQEAHVCTLCSKTFSSSSALKVHVETIHDRKHSYKCEECHETFNKKTNMQNHLRRVHQAAESKRLQCDLCRQEVPVSSELRKHVERVHLKCAPARSCVPSAGSPSATPGHEVHLSAVHNKDTQYPCPACSMVFYRLNDHGQPQAAHARGKEVRTHVCPTCSKGFCSNSDLRTHINVVHQDVRKHVCDVCDKAFKVASHLTYHKRKHTGETRLPVSVLQQGLRGPGNISEHVKKCTRRSTSAWRSGGNSTCQRRRLAAAQNAIHFTASEQAAHTVASTQASIHSLAPVNASTSAVYSFIPYIATTGHADVIQVPSTQVLTPTDGSTFHATPAIVASQGVIDHVNAYINF
nr:zinc finger protein 430-like [Penaeus vannamei]